MSIYDHMAWAKRQKTGSVGKKAVLMALAERTGEEPVCWPSQKLLADETEQSERTVRRCLEELVESGLVSKRRVYIDQHGQPLPRGKARNQYTLSLVDQAANLTATPEPTKRPNEVRPNGQTEPTKRPNTPDQAVIAMTAEVPEEQPSLNLHEKKPAPSALGVGREIAAAVWDTRKQNGEPTPATPFIAVARLGEKFVKAGHSRDAVVDAMLAVPTISTGWIEGELRKRARRPATGARQKIAEHGGPAGRVVDL